ncbi:GGDEF domain-containing protein [Mangrovibacillus cuniculi]|uniref:Sensor domain-containing phosphodiesterase n=1 Tax=Mangrovibacillus cuniculi TaxID=2593652 RepID=A0A7S8HGU2_9BACI|nr:GGDEF domain-containing protein [Mangrovibacillus cuniculi]QPC48157.1 sensor domain-containing phosphodiesterase [Mangrovibacillus cuniculi]
MESPQGILMQQQAKILEIAKSREIEPSQLQNALVEICGKMSTLVNVERVGVWLSQDDDNKLHNYAQYDKQNGHYRSDTVLEESSCMTYFNLLHSHRTIAVDNIYEDERTKELVPFFLEQASSVSAMLDAPIITSSGVKGVLCCESFVERKWTAQEQLFAGTFADMIAIILERMERLEVERQLEKLAFFDQLTDLPNQNHYCKYVSSKIDLSPVKPFNIVYIRIDKFEYMQDVLGYECGENLVRDIAQRLGEKKRKEDFIARVGNYHFVLVTEPIKETICSKLSAMYQELTKPFFTANQEIYCTFSMGVSSYPEHGEKPEILLSSARSGVLQNASKVNRGGIYHFEKNAAQIMETDLHIEMNLRKALELDQFELYYQPQINTLTQELKGYEALIRWNHPDLGIVSPAKFIPMAESTGIIVEIGEWVVDQALSTLKAWNTEKSKDITISINASARQFLHKDFPSLVGKYLDKHQVCPSKLVIEITESLALENTVEVSEQLTIFNKMGVSISIDDFGAGYSSLTYLLHFPVSTLKLDRQFIQHVHQDPKSMIIIKTLIRLAKDLDINLIAEGVEEEEQSNLLQDLGCYMIQGYLYGKPMPKEEAFRFLLNSNKNELV